ncbi:hypothetical protein NL676_034149 [Syzygium grande]|nr:hypothetical protein NL676_034149 [Syzygium grande]
MEEEEDGCTDSRPERAPAQRIAAPLLEASIAPRAHRLPPLSPGGPHRGDRVASNDVNAPRGITKGNSEKGAVLSGRRKKPKKKKGNEDPQIVSGGSFPHPIGPPGETVAAAAAGGAFRRRIQRRSGSVGGTECPVLDEATDRRWVEAADLAAVLRRSGRQAPAMALP